MGGLIGKARERGHGPPRDGGRDIRRGGGKADRRRVFANSHALMQQGAHGMVYGRNIYQHASPSRVVRALMAMIHDGANDEAAWRIYEERG